MSLSPQDFPWAAPSGNPFGSGTYFTVYPSSRPNTDIKYISGNVRISYWTYTFQDSKTTKQQSKCNLQGCLYNQTNSGIILSREGR